MSVYIDGELKKVAIMKAPNFSDVRNMYMYMYMVRTIGFLVPYTEVCRLVEGQQQS